MRRLVGVIIVFLIIFTFAACRQPVGSVVVNGGGGAGGGGIGVDFLWLVPARQLYDTEQWFVPDNDLQIMYAGDGTLKPIACNAPGLVLVLREHYEGDFPNPIPLPPSGEIKLNTAGRHQIVVTYKGQIAHYVIEVRGTYSGGGDESDLIDFFWP